MFGFFVPHGQSKRSNFGSDTQNSRRNLAANKIKRHSLFFLVYKAKGSWYFGITVERLKETIKESYNYFQKKEKELAITTIFCSNTTEYLH